MVGNQQTAIGLLLCYVLTISHSGGRSLHISLTVFSCSALDLVIIGKLLDFVTFWGAFCLVTNSMIEQSVGNRLH
jgi:hypothetical protein